MRNLSQLLRRLADSGWHFVIVGGFAAVTHGSSYVTRDLDVCMELTPETLRQLRTALSDLHPEHRSPPQRLGFLEFPPEGQAVQNLDLETDLGILDVLSSVLGVGGFARVAGNAETVAVDGREFRVMSLGDLIAAKDAVGREKDLLTAKELRVIAARRSGDPASGSKIPKPE